MLFSVSKPQMAPGKTSYHYKISRGKFKNTHGDCLYCFLLGMFLLCGIEDSLKQHWMKKEATDRRLQVCFGEAEVSTAPPQQRGGF